MPVVAVGSPSSLDVIPSVHARYRDTQRRHRPSMPAGQAAGVQGVSTPDTHTVHGGCGGMSGRPFRPLETMQVGHEGPRLCPGALRYSALLHIIRPRRRDLVRRRQSRQRLTRRLPRSPRRRPRSGRYATPYAQVGSGINTIAAAVKVAVRWISVDHSVSLRNPNETERGRSCRHGRRRM